MNDASLAIDLSNVTKRFGATVALDGASFSREARRGACAARRERRGQVDHGQAVVGTDAARRGQHPRDGPRRDDARPKDAHRAGVQTAFQEMTLVRDLTVAQNLLMSYEPTGWLGRIKQREAQRHGGGMARQARTDRRAARRVYPRSFVAGAAEDRDREGDRARARKCCCSTSRLPRCRAATSRGFRGVSTR